MDTQRLISLIRQYRQGTISQADRDELFDFLESDEAGLVTIPVLESQLMASEPESIHQPTDIDFHRWQPILDQILATDKPTVQLHTQRPVRFFPFRRWAVAAAVLILLAGAAWWFTAHQYPARADQPVLAKAPDIAPGGNKAMLTLSGGRQIILDSAHTGFLTRQGGAQITKTDNGRLTYKTANGQTSDVVYNTLSTPRGGQYQLTLPDGTRVWLNAASSITYPTAFTGRQRNVTITGEAYLEVAKIPSQPFTVTVNHSTIAVLGTYFNINAYPDEPAMTTTLLEGALNVTANGKSQLLQPGEQTMVKGAGPELNTHADIEQVMAWRNSRFAFNDANLPAVMRELSRWYDVDVIYEGPIPERHFNGRMGKTLTLAQVLSLMKELRVHYTIEHTMDKGNQLIIKP